MLAEKGFSRFEAAVTIKLLQIQKLIKELNKTPDMLEKKKLISSAMILCYLHQAK